MKYVVRLLGIEINNIKNVIHGEIEAPKQKGKHFMNLRSQWIWKNSSCGLYGIAEISSFRTSDPVKFLLLYK